MEDAEPEVVRQTIQSLGLIGEVAYVPWIVDRLGDRQFRENARDALSAFGFQVVEVLERFLDDTDVDANIHRYIPRVLGDIHAQVSVDVLLKRLERSPTELVDSLIRGLNKLRVSPVDLHFDPEIVDNALVTESKSYYQILQLQLALKDVPGTKEIDLLRRAMEEKLWQMLERIFRLLGLRHSPKDMYHAYLGFVSPERAIRASALEFLDNILDREMKDQLIPILDPVSVEDAVLAGRGLFGGTVGGAEDALTQLIRGNDPWLQACAIHCVAEIGSSEVVHLVAGYRQDSVPIVSETAELVLRIRGV